MGDYLLEFGDNPRATDPETLRFYPDMDFDRIQADFFTLSLTRTGPANLWAPYTSPDGTIVAIAGRIALDPADWDRAASQSGSGGLACKAIYNAFYSSGYDGIQRLNGAYAIHIYQPALSLYSLILDPAGCYPSYRPADFRVRVFSSHPDVLATHTGLSNDWDVGSLATFLSTGQVSHPNTYYRKLVGIEHGTRIMIDLTFPAEIRETQQRYVSADEFRIAPRPDEDELAEALAAAMARSVRQITQPRLGTTYLALSGGLDSRMIASHAIPHERMHAFSILGQQVNSEYRTAEAIAKTLGIRITPLVRSFDHYADNAELGVQISGGMGSITSNHFLGFRETLRELGCDNLITGCYFDYLFKSLAIDCKQSRFLRRESLTSPSATSYLPYFAPERKHAPDVERQVHQIHRDGADPIDATDRLKLMARRTFPLCREGDNIQRLVALRVFDWYSPAVFRDILEVYWRIPLEARLNKSLYKKAVLRSIPDKLRSIPDNNTLLPVDAPQILESVFRYRVAFNRWMYRHSQKIDTSAAWLNWRAYLRQSQKVRVLWCEAAPSSRDLISDLTGRPFSEDIAAYLSRSPEYFLRLLTLELWANQR